MAFQELLQQKKPTKLRFEKEQGGALNGTGANLTWKCKKTVPVSEGEIV